jgi:hypothetical protein
MLIQVGAVVQTEPACGKRELSGTQWLSHPKRWGGTVVEW